MSNTDFRGALYEGVVETHRRLIEFAEGGHTLKSTERPSPSPDTPGPLSPVKKRPPLPRDGLSALRKKTAHRDPPRLILGEHFCSARPAVACRAFTFPVLVTGGLICAIVIAGVVALQSVDISRDCRGAFGLGFSNDFDRDHCDLTVRFVGGPK
jgi:hypothetical protein